jgi:hypothetical protein
MDPWQYEAKTKSEHSSQVALFMWANMAQRFGLAAANNPDSYNVKGVAQSYVQPANGHKLLTELKWLHAISNHGEGFGRKAEGVKKGVADIFLPVPKWNAGSHNGAHSGFWQHGLYIELKRLDSQGKKAGVASQEQIDFQTYARSVGYAHEIIFGWELARDCILSYCGRS